MIILTHAAGIYTLSLHDALPISVQVAHLKAEFEHVVGEILGHLLGEGGDQDPLVLLRADPDLVDEVVDLADRKSTRLNSSHANISYAVFCLKKKMIGAVDDT